MFSDDLFFFRLKVHPVCLLRPFCETLETLSKSSKKLHFRHIWTGSLFCYTPFNCETYQSYLKTLNFWQEGGENILVDGQKSLKASVENKS